MIASHNTFTYLKPTKWWMRLINFAAKCQNKTFDEQYATGARYFDIRIKNLRDVSLHYDNMLFEHNLGHTVTTYSYQNIEYVIDTHPDCGFRIVNEDSKNKLLFERFCKHLVKLFPANIHVCIEGRDTWKVIVKGDYPDYTNVTCYSQKPKHWWQFGIRWPWLENKVYSRPTNEEINNPTKLFWYDFI